MVPLIADRAVDPFGVHLPQMLAKLGLGPETLATVGALLDSFVHARVVLQLMLLRKSLGAHFTLVLLLSRDYFYYC